MSEKEASKNDGTASVSWSTDHHLVGSTLTTQILRRSDEIHYAWMDQVTTVVAFQPENLRQRQPALWRSLLIDTTTAAGRDSNDTNDKATPPASPLTVRALDHVSTDWQVPESLAPPSTADGSGGNGGGVPNHKDVLKVLHQQVEIRVAQHLLNVVVRDYMPALILAAALEETQSQYLRQRRRQVEQENDGAGGAGALATRSTAPLSSLPTSAGVGVPLYYTSAPTAYLTPPIAPTAAHVDAPAPKITLTPSQLLPRIKQGCKLAYDWYASDMMATAASATTTTAPPSASSHHRFDKRASSRLARQQEEALLAAVPDVEQWSNLYKVQPGGRVADHISDWYTAREESLSSRINGAADGARGVDGHTSNNDRNQNVEVSAHATDDQMVGEELSDLDVDEHMALLLTDNPYMHPSKAAVLEWLGKKTAKLINMTELQSMFPAVAFMALPATTKKKKAPAVHRRNRQEIGLPVGKVATSLDRSILSRVLPYAGSNDSMLIMEATSDHDGVHMEDMEVNYFGRIPFHVKIVDEFADQELDLQAEDRFIAAEQSYKARKAWDTWRHRGVHQGHAVWPSWTDSVAAWLQETVQSVHDLAADYDTAPVIMPVEDANGPPTNVDGALGMVDDAAVARAMAEQEEVSTVAGRRRPTRRAAESGSAFYGTQSHVSQRQLMETVLRIISQKRFQTINSLMSIVPDESRDPIRRMRTSLGRLVFKRNQLARLTASTAISDGMVWDTLQSEPLLQSTRTVAAGLNDALETSAADLDLDALVIYVRGMHRTELQLRKLVLAHLSEVPVSLIATAADERQGTIESMDDADYEDPTVVEWWSHGHELLGKKIFRPAVTHVVDGHPPCAWYRVDKYSESIAATLDEAQNPLDRPQIGWAKDCTAVERRMRFRAVPLLLNGDIDTTGALIYLTEGQVRAGAKAAALELQESSSLVVGNNPYAGNVGAKVTLFRGDDQAVGRITDLYGIVAGHDSVFENGTVVHRVLLLPDGEDQAHWAKLAYTSSNVLTCVLEGHEGTFNIRQFDYHSSSPAFQACKSVVQYLEKHPKIGPFLVPVDPVALGIPSYFDVVKKPMDVSTLASKLENGQYSNIPPTHMPGASPTTRMLNGMFRRDLELIFDNAILFNSPKDWIHLAALSIKKGAQRKIELTSKESDEHAGRSPQKRSIYLDEESDVDMYDSDEDYTIERRPRKRKEASKIASKEDASSFAVERPVRLQRAMGDSSGLGGQLSNLPVRNDAALFSLPSFWTCLRGTSSLDTDAQPEADALEEADKELDDLMSLQKQVDDNENAGLRRSARASTQEGDTKPPRRYVDNLEFMWVGSALSNAAVLDGKITSRADIERCRERLHEEVFAKIYHDSQSKVNAMLNSATGLGQYVNQSFPPYLGQVHPELPPESDVEGCWEIRAPYMVAALRWVIRGLVRSGHLSEVEHVTADSLASGVVLVNHAYYLDPTMEPYEILDQRELVRRKRVNQENDAAAADDESDVELTEYEKLRAERVARNADRLKALGLA